jgi:hypothetical protein
MPNQNITYKVRIDPTDLYSQLQTIRDQINQTLSAQTFSMVQPGTQPGVAFPLPSIGAFPTPQIPGNLAPPIGAIGNASTMGFSQLENITQATRLGFQKLNNDVQNLILSQGAQQYGLVNDNIVSQINHMGFFNKLAASVGIGWSPNMSMAPGLYEQFARESMANSAFQTAIVGSFSALGGAVGSIFDPWGEAAGNIVGGYIGQGANDVVGATIGRTALETENYRQFIRNTSWRDLGGRITFNEAGQIGQQLSQFSRSNTMVGTGMRTSDVERVLREYTEIGGFEYTRSADEYETKAKNLIANTRKVMQTLMVSEKEALQMMHELELYGLGKENINSFSLQVATKAYTAGLMPSELLQFGAQAAEMVRGTGINMGQAFLGGMSALASIKAAEQTGALPLALVTQLGGESQAAATMVREGYQWGNSLQGFTGLNALVAAGGNAQTAFANPQTMLGLAIGQVSGGGITGLATAFGKLPELVSQYSPEAQFDMKNLMVRQAMRSARMGINKYSFRYMAEQAGMTATEADLGWASLQHTRDEAQGLNARIYVQKAMDSTPSSWQVLKDSFVYGVENTLDSSGIAGVARNIDNYFQRQHELSQAQILKAAGVTVDKKGILHKSDTFIPNADNIENLYANSNSRAERLIAWFHKKADQGGAFAKKMESHDAAGVADPLSGVGYAYAGLFTIGEWITAAVSNNPMIAQGVHAAATVNTMLASHAANPETTLFKSIARTLDGWKVPKEAAAVLMDKSISPEDALKNSGYLAMTNMDKNFAMAGLNKGYLNVRLVNP